MKRLMCNLWRGENLPRFSNDAYGWDDVQKLWNTASRHVDDLLLTVLCDDHYANQTLHLDGNIEIVRYGGYGVGGWSNVMECFRPDLHENLHQSRTVVVGLDTVFVGDSNWLWQPRVEPVSLPMDPFYTDLPCDAVITFDRLGAKLAWRKYSDSRQRHPYPYQLFNQPSEMVLLRSLWDDMNRPEFIEGNKMERLLSFKGCKLQDITKLPNASLVYFHGKPKLRDLDPEHPIRKEWERA